MKPFDLEKAKAGAEVCTRDGRKVRIICTDAKGNYPIVALVSSFNDKRETEERYDEKGVTTYGTENDDNALMLVNG